MILLLVAFFYVLVDQAHLVRHRQSRPYKANTEAPPVVALVQRDAHVRRTRPVYVMAKLGLRHCSQVIATLAGLKNLIYGHTQRPHIKAMRVIYKGHTQGHRWDMACCSALSLSQAIFVIMYYVGNGLYLYIINNSEC